MVLPIDGAELHGVTCCWCVVKWCYLVMVWVVVILVCGVTCYYKSDMSHVLVSGWSPDIHISHNTICQAFLVCGLSDEIIRHIPSDTGSAPPLMICLNKYF